jgi:hypothetical protein
VTDRSNSGQRQILLEPHVRDQTRLGAAEWLLGLDRSAQLGKLLIVSQPENAGSKIEAGQPPLLRLLKQLVNLASKLQRPRRNSIRFEHRRDASSAAQAAKGI